MKGSRLSWPGCAGALALALSSAWIAPASAQSAPENIEDAVAIVAKITDPDPGKQDALKAQAAYNMVTDRIKIINDASGHLFQRLPVDFWNYFSSCGNIKARTQTLDIARAKGWDIARASWIVRAGACDENASLMTEILKRGGVKNITILRSPSPHAFPVVGLAPDADPDIPWTWGPNAVVPDSWSRKLYPTPLDLDKIWEDSLYFNGGENFVAAYAHTTTRELLSQMVKRGDDYIKQHCDVYRPAMVKFMRIPEKYRLKMTLKPPKVEDVCPLTGWAGDTWYGDGGRAKYNVTLAGGVLAIAWTYDDQPEGEFYDCKISGAQQDVADCKVKQSGLSGTVHIAYKHEEHGDRISGKIFDGTAYWDVDIFRDR